MSSDNSAQEIRALDGLRACAALSVVLFHVFLVSHASLTFLGPDGTLGWYYLMTGVHLFFVLSGLLLFLPFVRAPRTVPPVSVTTGCAICYAEAGTLARVVQGASCGREVR